MDRLDHKTVSMPAPLEAAFGELQAAIEHHSGAMLKAAAARASAIEGQAARKAEELEASSNRASAAIDRATRAIDRSTRMLEAIDSMQIRFTESLSSLRSETEKLLEVLEQERRAGPLRGREAGERPAHEADTALAELLFVDEPY